MINHMSNTIHSVYHTFRYQARFLTGTDQTQAMRMKTYQSLKSNGTLQGSDADIFAGIYTNTNCEITTNR